MNRKKSVLLIAILCVLPLIAILIELQWHYVERIVGSYLETHNAERGRLERFVQQEIQTSQALEDVNRLVEIRTQEEQQHQEESDGKTKKPDIRSDVVELDQGQKLIMSRARFMDVQRQFRRTEHAIPRMTQLSKSAFLKAWTRTILVRPGWLQAGEIFFVDDDNYILYRMPVLAGQFDRFDTYAMNTDMPFEDDVKRIYMPPRFFSMLRGLPAEIRDQVINPSQFLELEATAKRIGISDTKRRIYIERIIGGQVGIIPIPVSSHLLQQIDLALGEA
jgi:hypothetical protein